MHLRRLRPVFGFALITILMLASTAAVSANTTSKTINTTTGECSEGGCGAAVFGTNGFSGRLFGTGSASLADYICVHTPGTGSFVSFPGTYTFTVSSGGSQLATGSYLVTGGVGCTSNNNAAGGSVSFTYPASGFVEYSVSVSGVTPSNAQSTFSRYNSILNRVISADLKDHAQSESVPPPGPGGEVPEVPAAALLILSGGIGAGWFLLRRRSDTPISVAND